MNIVQEFAGDHRFLSNFYPAPTAFGNVVYPSAEHAYQAFKTADMGEREEVRLSHSPGEAKRTGKLVTLRKDWEVIKLATMHEVVLAKFSQNFVLGSQLVQTGDMWLVEGNLWGDEFWGKCLKKNQGENWLGRILMLVRSELQL